MRAMCDVVCVAVAVTLIRSRVSTSEMSRSKPVRSNASTADVDRERRAGGGSPLSVNAPLGIQTLEFEQSARCTLTPRPRVTKPTIALGRRGLAALRGQREQLVDADDQHAALLPPPRLARNRRAAVSSTSAAAARLQRILQLLRADRAACDLDEQIVELRVSRMSAASLSRLSAVEAVALQLLVENRAALREIGFEVLPVEPLPHLAARALALRRSRAPDSASRGSARPASPPGSPPAGRSGAAC